MHLSDLHTGETGVIVKVSGHGGFRKRIVEMGFVKGKAVRVILNAPLRDPIEYEIMGYKVSLRREEARLVEVVSESEAEADERLHASCPLRSLRPGADEAEEQRLRLERHMERMASDKRRTITVALVGNPNCGKTSLFNMASGGHEHVGNYSGVTVDAKEGTFTFRTRATEDAHTADGGKDGKPCSGSCGGGCEGCAIGAGKEYKIRLVDLPGTYSLSSYSPEELYVRRNLIDDTPDVVVNVVDASNLERNLYLTTQLIDMHLRMVVALNMYDDLRRSGDRLDHHQLGHLLGVPMVPTVSRSGEGLRELFETVVAVYERQSDDELQRHIHINHGAELEQSIDRLKVVFQKNDALRSRFSTRYLAIKFLEGDRETEEVAVSLPQRDELFAVRFEETARLKEELHETPDNALTDAKYGYIQGALRETLTTQARRPGKSLTERIDAVVTGRYLGFPLFFLLLFLIFDGTFVLGQYPMDWIDWTVGKLSDFVSYALPEGMLRDMLVDGAISGVGSVIVFLPNILILYLFISLLEDTGYMARAAFIMDKLMHRMGLHGKSFIPMVMGFGCNVPAIMATRTIENPKSRLVTMLVTPFMSCSARIPIYVVLIAAFFPEHGALVLLSLYALGIVAAVAMARVFSRFLLRGDDLPFVMELPPYRLPNARSVLRHTWEKGRQYLRKMGGIILLFSLVIWALGYFPHNEDAAAASAESTAPAAVTAAQSNGIAAQSAAENGVSVKTAADNGKTAVSSVENSASNAAAPAVGASAEGETVGEVPSYLERLGRAITPVLSPMGFDWRMSVGILSGVGAKELVVSTLAVMYAGEDAAADNAEGDSRLSAALRQHMSAPSALAYLVFVLFYFPCIATITAIKNECGGWKWALFAAAYTTAFAYAASWLTYLAAVWAGL